MLLQSITEIKEFLAVSAGNDFDRLSPHIVNAEKKYIKPLLGETMYDEIVTFYGEDYSETPTDLQKAKKDLLEKIQHALIHLAYFEGFDFLNISATDAGFHRSESDRKKGLFKYQEDNLKNYFQESGLNGLDDVLIYLEKKITLFETFKNSENWTEYKQSFLPSVKIIEAIPYNIHSSRLIFLALKPHISYAEDTEIKSVLGSTIYQEIKTEMAKASPAEKVTSILPYIRKPLIYLSAALLMEETGATLYDKGLFFEKYNATYPDNKLKGPSTPDVVAERVKRERLKASVYLEALKNYLLANSEDWENYDGQTGYLFNRDNTNKKTFWT